MIVFPQDKFEKLAAEVLFSLQYEKPCRHGKSESSWTLSDWILQGSNFSMQSAAEIAVGV